MITEEQLMHLNRGGKLRHKYGEAILTCEGNHIFLDESKSITRKYSVALEMLDPILKVICLAIQFDWEIIQETECPTCEGIGRITK